MTPVEAPPPFDHTQFAWLDHSSIGHPTSHIRSIELLRDSVIQPSLQALDREIDALRASDDEAADFFAEDIADVFHTSVEGYLLTVQSLWERGLRSMLIIREKALHGGQVEAIERAHWGGKHNLQDHFARLMGLRIEDFDTYEDLDLLQLFGSAIRHGDGRAARKIYDRHPSLWFNWLAPGSVFTIGATELTIPIDGPRHPPYSHMTLPEELLHQMLQSVEWFWTDIETIRCRSFKAMNESTVAGIATWDQKRESRRDTRVWPRQP